MTILPNREALFEQFLGRARTGEYEEWWDKPETLRRMKRKLRAGLLRLLRRRPKFLREGHLTSAQRLCVRRAVQHVDQPLGEFS